jgi:protein-tyrosine phosphatase
VNSAPKDWLIDSAGTSGWHEGERPDTRSILTAKNHNIPIEDQRSRKFVLDDFEKYDIIFAMDSSNFSNLTGMAPNKASADKIRLLMNESYPGENRQVPDPYTGGQQGFEQVYQMLNHAIHCFLESNS